MKSSIEGNVMVSSHTMDNNSAQLTCNEKPNQISTSAPTSNTPTYSNFYNPTPSPADSGVMSPLTPLSNYTSSISGPNCTPEQNFISSPEHSINYYSGCPTVEVCGRNQVPSCSVYSDNTNCNLHYTHSHPESEYAAIPCSIPNHSLATLTTSATAFMTHPNSEENLETVENYEFIYHEAPQYYPDNVNVHQNWASRYSENFSMQYHQNDILELHPKVEMVRVRSNFFVI